MSRIINHRLRDRDVSVIIIIHIQICLANYELLFAIGDSKQTEERCTVSRRPLVAGLAVEAVLGEEVARNEPVFTKCERKPQSQLVQVGEYLQYLQ